MTSIVGIEELGRRIRKLRLDRRMTLKQVEQGSGLSATHLSEIERGRTSPTIGALVRIARALEKDASYFIEPEERAEIAHQLREQVKTFSPSDGIQAELLTPGIPGSEMFSYRLTVRALPSAELRMDAQDVPGEALYFLQRGRLETEFGDQRVELNAGDSVHASLLRPHRLKAAGREAAELLVISTRALGVPS